jgi:predicted neuraminidase
MQRAIPLLMLLMACPAMAREAADLGRQPGVVAMEFIYERAPFPQCHASTLAETPSGLVAAWFGGTREGHPDVGVWLARRENGQWTAPVEVADGVQHADKRYPCWNPVLYQAPEGPLLLFYKVGPSPSQWWGMVARSHDGGKTWDAPRRLPEDILGPIKNKPVLLAGGSLLCPSSTEHGGWRVHFEITPDLGRTWRRVGPVADPENFRAIQPTVLLAGGGRLTALCRARGGKIVATYSNDGGATWSPLEATDLPNPNSGIDAVTLADGRHLLVYNHVGHKPGKWGGSRSPLNVAVSADGRAWRAAVVLEDQPGEYSYPAVIQTADGLVHITYTWRRKRVKHVVLDPAKLVPSELPKLE